MSAIYITPHTRNNFNFRYFIIIHILFYSILYCYSALNFNQIIWLVIVLSDSDTFNYNCILYEITLKKAGLLAATCWWIIKLKRICWSLRQFIHLINPYPTAFPYGNGIVLHFYQQQESSTTKTVHKVINKGLKTYV